MSLLAEGSKWLLLWACGLKTVLFKTSNRLLHKCRAKSYGGGPICCTCTGQSFILYSHHVQAACKPVDWQPLRMESLNIASLSVDASKQATDIFSVLSCCSKELGLENLARVAASSNAAVANLLQTALQQGQQGCVDRLLEFPAAAQLSADMVAQLLHALLKCSLAEPTRVATQLCGLDAAQHLSSTTAEQLLHAAIKQNGGSHHSACVEPQVGLPAAGELSSDSALLLALAAVQHKSVGCYRWLSMLPGVGQLDSAALGLAIEEALDEESGVEQLSCNVLARLLLGALQAATAAAACGLSQALCSTMNKENRATIIPLATLLLLMLLLCPGGTVAAWQVLDGDAKAIGRHNGMARKLQDTPIRSYNGRRFGGGKIQPEINKVKHKALLHKRRSELQQQQQKRCNLCLQDDVRQQLASLVSSSEGLTASELQLKRDLSTARQELAQQQTLAGRGSCLAVTLMLGSYSATRRHTRKVTCMSPESIAVVHNAPAVRHPLLQVASRLEHLQQQEERLCMDQQLARLGQQQAALQAELGLLTQTLTSSKHANVIGRAKVAAATSETAAELQAAQERCTALKGEAFQMGRQQAVNDTRQVTPSCTGFSCPYCVAYTNAEHCA
ncbi:hypothetical protein COO60DRAFT_1624708 [Scenedesmus sp. NREL 46B-D3]|nr:hypothetical protein COO60DRAFT_1624708 [Scenedesmus sp. NREL 46B-D3]